MAENWGKDRLEGCLEEGVRRRLIPEKDTWADDQRHRKKLSTPKFFQ